MQEFKPFKEGKVREVYDNGDSLIIVATDRISALIIFLRMLLRTRVQYLHRCPSSGSITRRILSLTI